jgi:hypothetical protein
MLAVLESSSVEKSNTITCRARWSTSVMRHIDSIYRENEVLVQGCFGLVSRVRSCCQCNSDH